MIHGLLLFQLLHLAAARECAARSDNLRSIPSSESSRAHMEWKNNFDIDLLVMWVNEQGLDQAAGILSANANREENTFLGHAFRFYSAIDPNILVYEHIVSKEKDEVAVERCTINQQEIFHAELANEDFEALIHDQKAPCLPADQSSAWSCVRSVSQAEFEARTSKRFGFATEQEAQDRQIGEMTDTGYTDHIHAIPRLTKGPGYLKMSFTKKMRDTLLQFYADKKTTYMEQHEPISGGYTNSHVKYFDKLNLDRFPDIHYTVVSEMRKVLQWWVGSRLKHTSTFGIRIYRREAMLINHVDRMDTHLASAVLQIAQECDEGWPLEVVRENGERYEVYLQPGEMVLYEGAKLKHGRPMRFNGTEFGNVFTHFAPIHWNGPGKSPHFKPEDFNAKKHEMEL